MYFQKSSSEYRDSLLCNPSTASVTFRSRQTLGTRTQRVGEDQGHIDARVDDNDASRPVKRDRSSSIGGPGIRRRQSRRRLDLLCPRLRPPLGILRIPLHDQHVSRASRLQSRLSPMRFPGGLGSLARGEVADVRVQNRHLQSWAPRDPRSVRPSPRSARMHPVPPQRCCWIQ